MIFFTIFQCTFVFDALFIIAVVVNITVLLFLICIHVNCLSDFFMKTTRVVHQISDKTHISMQ